MNKFAYLECPTGIAGDMCLGALVDIGVPLEYLQEKLQKLGIDQEYQLRAEKVHKNGQIATKIHVDLLHAREKHDHHHHHHPPARHLPQIEQLIEAANFTPQTSVWSLKIFRILAVAEGAVHGIAPEKVHFHEVGATDAIVDIVGTCLGLDWLGIDELYCSSMPTGGGIVNVAHGRLPVPVPAVLKLWEMRQVPVYNNGIEKELVTPTGAAIVTALATNFGAPPAMTIEKIGLGAGSLNLPIPNLVRLWLGKKITDNNLTQLPTLNYQSPILETISVLETQIDDLSPQAIGYTFEELFKVGAVDVFTGAIGMKKSRPGILLTVICPPEKVSICEEIIFRETTTLGIRHLTQQRRILSREIQQVETPLGNVAVKIAFQETEAGKKIINVQPEYEDCARLARENNKPWREIHQMVLDIWNRQQ
jgi:pyridinium-3,5-bisthiocarboxylic acid mononucleotide nickel chelatase